MFEVIVQNVGNFISILPFKTVDTMKVISLNKLLTVIVHRSFADK